MKRSNRSVHGRLLKALAFSNLALAAILLMPAPAQAEGAIFFDCCKKSTEGARYCCDSCCWITHDCTTSSTCQGGEET